MAFASLRWYVNRSLALAAAVLVLALFASRSARASTLLIKPGGDVHVSDLRIAHASSGARTVTWEQLVLDESRGELAWVVPVPKGGWLETGDDHWFEALDEATAAVIAPHKSLECGAFARESTAEYRASTSPRVISTGLASLAPAAAIDKLTSLGFVVDASTRAAILALETAGEEVTILTLPAGARGVTKVIRVLGPAGRPVPMTLMPSGGALPRLTAYTFAEGRAKFAGLAAVEVDAAKLSWSGGGSNYRTLLDDTIVAAAPGAALTFAGADGVFTDQPAGASGVTVTSLTRRYFGAADGCIARVAALSSSGKSVAPTCAKASPFISATPPSCAVTTSEQLPSNELACGAQDDLAAAAGGLPPARVVLTRLDGVAASFASGLPLQLSPLGSVLSFREAKLGPHCSEPNPTAPPEATNPPGGTTTPGGSSSPSGSRHASSSSSGDGCGATAQVFADSCTRSNSSSGGGCSGDSSSESDSCSGDSSSDSGGCSSDSSSGSDGCSGASDSADDGCSSSSSSSSGCSGAASSADDGCRAARVRPRIRFSAAVYALIGFLAFVRRFGRRSGYHRDRERCPETTSSDAPAHE